MRIRPTIFATALAAALLIGSAAGAVTVELSTFSGETLGVPGVPFRNGDVVRYDTVTQAAAVVFSEDSFGGPEDVDAWEVLPDASVLLSTFGSATLGGTPFENGDIVSWNGASASIVFSETNFLDQVSADIDAVSMHPTNGNLLFSTRFDATIGALSFLDGDIVMWDGSTASIFFAESAFTAGDLNVDAFDLAADGTFLLSTENDVTLDGTLYLNGDLILYDPGSFTASRVFPESDFATNPADIDAAAFAFDPVPVPEPGTASMLGIGLAGLAVAGRRRYSA
jgi:hypothetical protein